MLPLPCMLVCSCVCAKSHARSRVQQAPGLPCALFTSEGGKRRKARTLFAPRECERIPWRIPIVIAREGARSSTPRLPGYVQAPLEYWIARSSRTMTVESCLTD
jgi:hypothetical protein